VVGFKINVDVNFRQRYWGLLSVQIPAKHRERVDATSGKHSLAMARVQVKAGSKLRADGPLKSNTCHSIRRNLLARYIWPANYNVTVTRANSSFACKTKPDYNADTVECNCPGTPIKLFGEEHRTKARV